MVVGKGNGDEAAVSEEGVAGRHRLVLADFPQPEEYKRFFEKLDIYEMPTLDHMAAMIESVKKLTEEGLPRLLRPIKTMSVNPADRKATVRLQKAYFHQMQAQLAGHSGFQGSAEQMAPPPQRLQPMEGQGAPQGQGTFNFPANMSRQQVQQLIAFLQTQNPQE